MVNTAYGQYKQTQAATASPGELVVMLYNGAIRFLSGARQCVDAKDVEGANRNLVRAQEIVLELMISVDVSAGPVARNLFDIYEFIHGHLVKANIRKDGAMIDEAAGLMRELLGAWEQAVANMPKSRAVPGSQLGYAVA